MQACADDFAAEAPRPSGARARIVLKLRALLAKTVENGATEAEALAAAEKASALMEEHDLSYADVEEVRDERYGARRRPFAGGSARRRTHHESSQTHSAIMRFCDCRCWYSGEELVFFGTAHDTETAHALADMVRLAMDREFAAYLNSDERDRDYHGRTLRASFMMGMAGRVSQRLHAMKNERTARVEAQARTAGAASPDGRSLVLVAKSEVVKERYDKYLADRGIIMGRGRSSYRSSNSTGAHKAGWRAGDRVGLNPSLGGTNKRLGKG